MSLALTGIGLAVADVDLAMLAANQEQAIIQPQNLKVDTTDLNNFFPARSLRRVDHFTRMSLLAASRALCDHNGEDPNVLNTKLQLPEETGIIISTGYGPAETVFDFLDSIIDHGPSCASPLAFSHSVHNIPTATISLFLKSSCPYTTICQTHAPLLAALNNAACWITEGRVKNVLLGVVDEKTPLLADNTQKLLIEKNSQDPQIPCSEGACFFMLSRACETKSAKYGTIDFKTVRPDELSKSISANTVFTPQRTLGRLKENRINGRSVINADMPTSAGIALAAAAVNSTEEQETVCVEQAGRNFGLINISNKVLI